MREVALWAFALLLAVSFLGCAVKAKRRTPSWPVKGHIVYVSETLVPLAEWRPGQTYGSGYDQSPFAGMRPSDLGLATYPPCEGVEVLKVRQELLRLRHLQDGQAFELTGNWESSVHGTKEECLENVEPKPSQKDGADRGEGEVGGAASRRVTRCRQVPCRKS